MTVEDLVPSVATLAAISLRHWDPRSQPYAGADQLLTALSQGWQTDAVIDRQDHGRGGRQIVVYGFNLTRQGQQRRMWVVANPCVTRLIAEAGFQVHPETTREDSRSRFHPSPTNGDHVLRSA